MFSLARFLLCCSALSLVCSTFADNVKSGIEKADLDWWKHAVFYQIYPRSFKDSNNDGIGDLQGIISNLDHLKDIGVTAAWLSPIYSSPQVDQGYDISNFTDVHHEYGTLEDFDQLISKAKELGIRIVMDFVPNHSSDQHEWFAKSENGEAGYEDYYVWKDAAADGGPPNNWISVFKYSAWEWSEKRQQYYLHQFAIQQPDLNFNDPALVQEMKDVLTFWMDRGVEGFRVDAIPHMFEEPSFPDEPRSGDTGAQDWEYNYLDHIYTKDQPLTFDMVYQYRDLLDDYATTNERDTVVLMTEAYTSSENLLLYHGNGDRKGAHFSFNFWLLGINSYSTSYDVVDNIKSWMNLMGNDLTPNWVIGNHDNFRAATRYGVENVDGMNMLVAMLPGVQVTYNGEEIGMENGEVTWEQGQDTSACNGSPEDFPNVSRDFERTPFHWDDSTNAGFNEGAETWLPVSSKYTENNLAKQKIDQKSHYYVYKDLMILRQTETLTYGQFQIYSPDEKIVVVYRKLSGYPGYVLIYNKSQWASNVGLGAVVEGLSSNLEVVLTNVQSSKEKGNILSSELIVFDAYECVIALEVLR